MGCVGRVQHSQKFGRFFVGICKLGIFVCCLKECQGQLSSIPFATRGQFVRKRPVKILDKTPWKSEKFEIVWYRSLATVVQCYVLWNPRNGEVNDKTINRFWGEKFSTAEPYFCEDSSRFPEELPSKNLHSCVAFDTYSYRGYCCVVYVQYYPLKHCGHNNHRWVARGHRRRWISSRLLAPNGCGKESNFTKASSQVLC